MKNLVDRFIIENAKNPKDIADEVVKLIENGNNGFNNVRAVLAHVIDYFLTKTNENDRLVYEDDFKELTDARKALKVGK